MPNQGAILSAVDDYANEVADERTVALTAEVAELTEANTKLLDDNGALMTALAEAAAEIIRLQAIIDGDPPPPPPPPPSTALMGVSDSAKPGGGTWPAGPLETCDAVRVYSVGKVDSAVTRRGSKLVALSDESGISTALQLDNALGGIFGKSPDLLVDWMHHNEVSSESLDIDAYARTVHEMRAITDKYPGARMGINLTAYTIRQGLADRFKVCTPDLQIIYSSCYNPGRFDTPPTWDDYPDFIDPILDLVANWGIPRFGCGEFGNPIAPGDPAKRPDYAGKAARYMRDGCAARGIEFVAALWWNSQKDGGPNNKLETDLPATAQAWKDALTEGA